MFFWIFNWNRRPDEQRNPNAVLASALWGLAWRLTVLAFLAVLVVVIFLQAVQTS